MDLYVSDLDGTLLNSEQKISEKSKKILNNLINNNDLKFTIATARTPATTIPILEGVHMNFPAVMMNGVLIYDTEKMEYIDIKEISKEDVNKLFNIFTKHNKDFFVYAIKDNELVVYYRNMNRFEKGYFDERCNLKLKRFIHIDDYYKDITDVNVINLVVLDMHENLVDIVKEVSQIKGVTNNCYKDLYGDGNFFMDIYSSSASKAEAIKNIRKSYPEIKRIIAFGDNINDIPMFEQADECYAVENAAQALKEISTGIIDDHNNDAVADYINNKFK